MRVKVAWSGLWGVIHHIRTFHLPPTTHRDKPRQSRLTSPLCEIYGKDRTESRVAGEVGKRIGVGEK